MMFHLPNDMLSYPFPIRPRMLAHVVVPTLMTEEEAFRLCLFIESLAVPTPKIKPKTPGELGYESWFATSRAGAARDATE